MSAELYTQVDQLERECKRLRRVVMDLPHLPRSTRSMCLRALKGADLAFPELRNLIALASAEEAVEAVAAVAKSVNDLAADLSQSVVLQFGFKPIGMGVSHV